MQATKPTFYHFTYLHIYWKITNIHLNHQENYPYSVCIHYDV